MFVLAPNFSDTSKLVTCAFIYPCTDILFIARGRSPITSALIDLNDFNDLMLSSIAKIFVSAPSFSEVL